MSENTKTANDGISRRTVTKAMAWSVPAIAVAAPIPAFAASGKKPRIIPGPACKSPGGSGHCDWFKFGYGVNAQVINDSNKDIYICGVTITAQSPSDPVFTGKANLPIKVPAGGQPVDVLFAAVSTKSPNIQNGSITFSVAWGHEADCSGTDHVNDPIVFTVSWTSTPPGDCNCL